MSLAQSAALFGVFAVLFAVQMAMVGAEKSQSPYDVEAPITALKRFYSWEDSKRAASLEAEDGMRNKRKQFYAWAGKRSSAPVHYFEDAAAMGPSMEKRKQFYAWAGRK